MTARKTAPSSFFAYAAESAEPPGVERIPCMPEVVYVSTETPFGRALMRIKNRAFDAYKRGGYACFNDLYNVSHLKVLMAPWFSYGKTTPLTWAAAAEDLDRQCQIFVYKSGGVQLRRIPKDHPIAVLALQMDAGLRLADGATYVDMPERGYTMARYMVLRQMEQDRVALVSVLKDMVRAEVRPIPRPGYVGVPWSTAMACWAEARRLHEAGCMDDLHEAGCLDEMREAWYEE